MNKNKKFIKNVFFLNATIGGRRVPINMLTLR